MEELELDEQELAGRVELNLGYVCADPILLRPEPAEVRPLKMYAARREGPLLPLSRMGQRGAVPRTCGGTQCSDAALHKVHPLGGSDHMNEHDYNLRGTDLRPMHDIANTSAVRTDESSMAWSAAPCRLSAQEHFDSA